MLDISEVRSDMQTRIKATYHSPEMRERVLEQFDDEVGDEALRTVLSLHLDEVLDEIERSMKKH